MSVILFLKGTAVVLALTLVLALSLTVVWTLVLGTEYVVYHAVSAYGVASAAGSLNTYKVSRDLADETGRSVKCEVSVHHPGVGRA